MDTKMHRFPLVNLLRSWIENTFPLRFSLDNLDTVIKEKKKKVAHSAGFTHERIYPIIICINNKSRTTAYIRNLNIKKAF